MKKQILSFSLSILICLVLLPNHCLAAAQIVVNNNPQSLDTNQQLFQLHAQALQLEGQLLQVKQRILQLEQIQDLQKTQTTSVSAKNYQWVNAVVGSLPKHALIVAYANNQPVVICRATYLQGKHPGELFNKGCLISYGGKAFFESNHQVLTTENASAFHWQPATDLQPFLHPNPFYPPVPLTAQNAIVDNGFSAQPVIGGYEPNHSLYICRAMYKDAIHVGKTFGDGQYCNIGINNAEVRVATFEVLFDSN
jgi:hypothetical protein